MAVITAKTGEALAAGADPGRAGPEGHPGGRPGRGPALPAIPIFYDREILPVITIPARQGRRRDLQGRQRICPQGEFLAGPGQKGIWRQVLGPGKYRLNPYGYQIDVVDAISIPIGYAGVVTSPVRRAGPGRRVRRPGPEGRAQGHPAARPLLRQPQGVQGGRAGDRRQPGLAAGREGRRGHHQGADRHPERGHGASSRSACWTSRRRSAWTTWPSAQQAAAPMPAPAAAPRRAAGVAPGASDLDASAALSLDQFVEFPSRDGFEISLDMTVEFELLPEHIAWIFSSYGDLPAVVDKIIMPQITLHLAQQGLGVPGQGLHRRRGPREVPERPDRDPGATRWAASASSSTTP